MRNMFVNLATVAVATVLNWETSDYKLDGERWRFVLHNL